MQHVDHVGNFVHRRVFVHIGQNRHSKLSLDLAKNAQALFHARAAKTARGAAVRLVERRLVDKRNAEIRADFFERAGRIQRHRFALDDAGAGDQEDRLVIASLKSAQLHASATLGNSPHDACARPQ